MQGIQQSQRAHTFLGRVTSMPDLKDIAPPVNYRSNQLLEAATLVVAMAKSVVPKFNYAMRFILQVATNLLPPSISRLCERESGFIVYDYGPDYSP